MSSSVFWALVRKDLYLMRGMIIGMVVVGLVSFVATGLGGVGLAVGGIVFLTVNIGGGIFMAMAMMVGERKEMARTFALSLPISGRDYDRAKLTAGYLSFAIPWVIITGAAIGAFLFPGGDADRGMVVYALVLQGYSLAMYSVLLTVLFSKSTDGAGAMVIVGGNILFSLFMVQLNQPAISRPFRTDEIVWTPFAQWAIAGELLAIALSFAVAVFVSARRRDHV